MSYCVAFTQMTRTLPWSNVNQSSLSASYIKAEHIIKQKKVIITKSDNHISAVQPRSKLIQWSITLESKTVFKFIEIYANCTVYFHIFVSASQLSLWVVMQKYFGVNNAAQMFYSCFSQYTTLTGWGRLWHTSCVLLCSV